MTTSEAIILARHHAGNGAAMESSARLNLEMAVSFYDAGDYAAALHRAFRSLSYSVGIFHPAYKKVAKHIDNTCTCGLCKMEKSALGARYAAKQDFKK